jgi:hypothetical protein
LTKETLEYFDRKIYENQKEFFLDSIPRNFNRYYIAEQHSARKGNNLFDGMMNKSQWDDNSPTRMKKKKSDNVTKKL